jgi:tRNA U38,U39,U40 pseudouridine synthase TruA
MISSIVEVAAVSGDIEILKNSFDPKTKRHINNAPSQGLMLCKAEYKEKIEVDQDQEI